MYITMKRYSLLTSVIIICMLMLFGCGSSDDESKDGKSITSPRLEITLEENPSTGYDWAYEIADESIVKLVSDEFIEGEGAEDAVGVSGKHTFIFEGLAEGETQITMTLAQHWEGGEKEEIKEITVVVDKDGNIAEKN